MFWGRKVRKFDNYKLPNDKSTQIGEDFNYFGITLIQQSGLIKKSISKPNRSLKLGELVGKLGTLCWHSTLTFRPACAAYSTWWLWSIWASGDILLSWAENFIWNSVKEILRLRTNQYGKLYEFLNVELGKNGICNVVEKRLFSFWDKLANSRDRYFTNTDTLKSTDISSALYQQYNNFINAHINNS